jgi:hypothetical protein
VAFSGRGGVLCLLLLLVPGITEAVDHQQAFVRSIDRLMVGLSPQNLEASATIKAVYRDHAELLVLNALPEIEEALSTGGLVPLPSDPLRFNVMPRLDGLHPIGEMDLPNQSSYLAARPATIGCLLDVASRVKSGPLEITSLVRHGAYQSQLRGSNANAHTSIPMHTMGLAFDVALLNTPLPTVYEIERVLREMRDAGDVLFIGERRQLVFHVVPHPSRLGYFTDVYAHALAGTLDDQAWRRSSAVWSRETAAVSQPVVTTGVVAMRPTSEHAAEWWAARNPDTNVAIAVAASGPSPSPKSISAHRTASVASITWVSLIAAAAFGSVYHARRPTDRQALFADSTADVA